MSSSLSRLIFGSGGEDNDDTGFQHAFDDTRNRTTRREREFRGSQIRSDEVQSIPTVHSARHANTADKKIRFDLPDDGEEDGSGDYDDDWNEDDFEELDDEEIGSVGSPNGEYMQPGMDKRVDWRSTIDQQAAFMSALYTSYSTHQHGNDDINSSIVKLTSHTDDDDDDESNIRKIEAILRPEVVERPLRANLLPERAERLKPLIRKRKRRKKGVSGFVAEETLETEQQARYRVAMQDRAKEWRLMKARWKRRQYDYSNENDVGNAIGNMGRQVASQRKLDQKMKKRLLRRRQWLIDQKLLDHQHHRPKQETIDAQVGTDKRTTDERQEFQLRHQYPFSQDAPSDAGVVEEAGDSDGDEDSLDEQKQVLNRLLQNSASQEERPSDATTVEDEFEKDLKRKERPFQDQFNFWESGRSFPTSRDLDFCYGRERHTINKTLRKGKALSLQQEVAGGDDSCRLSMSLRQFVNIKGGRKSHDSLVGVANPRWYLPLPFNETSGSENDRGAVRGKFVHQRHLRCMAARLLCGGRGITSGISGKRRVEDRLLRALHSMAPGRGDGFDGRRDWNKRHRYFFHYSHRKHLLLHIARQRALDVKCFIEHIWSDPSLVATRLGLIQHRNGQHNPYQLAGNSMDLHRVQTTSQKQRAKILKSKKLGKSFRLRPVPEIIEDEEERDSKQAPGSVTKHEEPVGGLRVDGVESLNAPTSDAVVSDLRSMTSATKSSITSTKEYFKASYLSGLTLIGTVSSDYVHLQGTVPPIPSFPLDPTGIAFGPVDRYAGFHHMAKLDETTLALTVSTLLSRMAATTNPHIKDDKQKICSQLLSYLEKAPGLDLTNYYKFLVRTKSKMQDLPLVNSYNALMTGCSFVANSGFLYSNGISGDDVKKEKHGGDSSSDDSLYQDDDAGKIDACSTAGVNVVASRIHDLCESRIRHNGLLRFPRLHLTFAIARLCRLLPGPSAEILSRSTDDAEEGNSYSRTPVELMQLALMHLEKNHLIEEGGPTLDSEEGAIQVGLLEYRLYEAADVFRRCMKLDFFALDYHLWYIGSLSACVLLSSGNQIGSGARRFPSTRPKNGRGHSYFDQVQADGILDHEVRSQLPKFEDVREELRCAIRLLLDLAKHQTTQRQCWTKTHLAIASVFEWKQVIALVVGDSAGSSQVSDDPWSDIQAVHHYHASRWATRDRSSRARKYAAQLINHLDKNRQLALVAQDLESDPSSLYHWRRLVGKLGPIGGPIRDSEGSNSHKSTCPECKRIRKTLIIDHDVESQLRNNKDWWASGRTSWWDCCLLQMPQFEGRRSILIAEAIDKKMSASGPPISDNADILTSIDLDKNLTEKNMAELHKLSWLTERCSDNDDQHKPPSDRERAERFDQVLPQTFREVLNGSSPPLSDVYATGNRELDEPQMKGPNAQTLEVLCYKIIITCHMYGANHPTIEPAVWSIVMSFWENKNYTFADSDEWTALTWLSSRGLNIPQCLRDGCPT